jgi:hypothetical protein
MGLIGLVVMIVMTFMYFNEIGWKFLLGAWLIIIAFPLVAIAVGINGWVVLMVQMLTIGGVYLKAKSES